jgi:hypothetical protein
LKSQKSSSFIPKVLFVENINTPAKHSAGADFAADHFIIPKRKNTPAKDRQYFFLATGTV